MLFTSGTAATTRDPARSTGRFTFRLGLVFPLYSLYTGSLKVRDVVRIIEADGWRFHSQRGSHQQYVHAVKTGRVTVPGKPGFDLTGDLLSSIFRQAKIDRRKT